MMIAEEWGTRGARVSRFPRTSHSIRPVDWKRPERGTASDIERVYEHHGHLVQGQPGRGAADIEELGRGAAWITELEPDFDGEESPGYASSTLARALEFLRTSSEEVHNLTGREFELPRVLPGPAGSIDLHWKSDAYELLVNVPADPGRPANFYGDDYGKLVIKGSFEQSSTNLGLLLWFAGIRP